MTQPIKQSLKQTQDMLAKHHRNGEVFAEMMKESFASRFNEKFWGMWQEHIEPSLPEQATIVDLGTGPGSFLKAITIIICACNRCRVRTLYVGSGRGLA